jgi:hypothetical protein
MSHLTVIPTSIKEEAQRRADELFATLHILEIRDIANKTKYVLLSTKSYSDSIATETN